MSRRVSWSAERHSVTSSEGPISTEGSRLGMPSRTGMSSLSTGSEAPKLMLRSKRSVLKNTPRMPYRSALKMSPR